MTFWQRRSGTPTLRFGASINPYRRDALELLDKAVEAGAVLMKWLPRSSILIWLINGWCRSINGCSSMACRC